MTALRRDSILVSPLSSLVPLGEALDESRFGAKATQLGAALRAGLPVPPGFALAHDEALRALSLRVAARDAFADALAALDGLVAVRSSAVGEDSATASFAGQHATILGVRGVDAFFAALEAVLESARSEAAVAYRRKLGLEPHPRMGVVVQKLVRSDAAGVLFTRHPTTRADERVVEASWGLGEVVVQGLVTPDRFRIARGGAILERAMGDKDLSIHWAEEGGSEERPVAAEKQGALCLSDAQLGALEALASRCEAVFGSTQDLEFAFEGGALFLLQRRALTRG